VTARVRPSRAGWRDAVLFLTGLGLTIHEAIVYSGPERWGLLMLFAGMMGTPVFLRGDERRQANGTSPDPPPAAPEAPS
jgi:hypothetical protein